jgi:hypothetical protein
LNAFHLSIVLANGLPETEKKQESGISINDEGLDQRESSVGKVKRFVSPQYLVEPQYTEGTFEESRAA